MEAIVMLGFFALVSVLAVVMNPQEGQETLEPEVLGFGSGSD